MSPRNWMVLGIALSVLGPVNALSADRTLLITTEMGQILSLPRDASALSALSIETKICVMNQMDILRRAGLLHRASYSLVLWGNPKSEPGLDVQEEAVSLRLGPKCQLVDAQRVEKTLAQIESARELERKQREKEERQGDMSRKLDRAIQAAVAEMQKPLNPPQAAQVADKVMRLVNKTEAPKRADAREVGIWQALEEFERQEAERGAAVAK